MVDNGNVLQHLNDRRKKKTIFTEVIKFMLDHIYNRQPHKISL